jgi:hypothetical protein
MRISQSKVLLVGFVALSAMLAAPAGRVNPFSRRRHRSTPESSPANVCTCATATAVTHKAPEGSDRR